MVCFCRKVDRLNSKAMNIIEDVGEGLEIVVEGRFEAIYNTLEWLDV